MSRYLKRILNSYFVRFLTWLAAYNFVDLAAKYLPGKTFATDGRKRLVIVKMDGIGDYIVWTTTFNALDKIFPRSEYERVLIGSSRWKDIGEAENFFDQKVFIDPAKFVKSFRYRFERLRDAREWRADIVINPRLTREFLWSDAVVRIIPSKMKIGSVGLKNLMTPAAELISNRWYDRLLPPAEVSDHETESNRKFISNVAGLDLASSKPKIPLHQDPEIAIDGDYAVFVPGAMTDDKCWPAERFAEAAKYTNDAFGFQIVLGGGSADAAASERFIKHFTGDVIDMTGKTTLPQLADLIAGAKLVVTNDTGAGHIAAATGTPAAIITPGNFIGRFFPYPKEMKMLGVRQLSVVHEMPCFGCGWKCIYQDLGGKEPKPCIEKISANDLNQTIDLLLNRTT